MRLPTPSIGPLVVGLVVACAISAGCGIQTGSPSDYSPQVKQNFTAACAASAGYPEATCVKLYQCLEQKLPFSDFRAADRAIAAGQTVDPETEKVIAGCSVKLATGGGSGSSGGYSSSTKTGFVASCARTSGLGSRGTAICDRAYECIKQRLPYSKFVATGLAEIANKPVDPKTKKLIARCMMRALTSS